MLFTDFNISPGKRPQHLILSSLTHLSFYRCCGAENRNYITKLSYTSRLLLKSKFGVLSSLNSPQSLLQSFATADQGQEGALEKEMAIHSSILTWRIPWTEEPDRLSCMGLQESDTAEQLKNNKKNKM